MIAAHDALLKKGRTAAAPPRLPRVEPRTTRIVYADALRALAILAVFAHHTFLESRFSVRGRPWAFENLGDWGVDCFFVLTGFLLTGPYVKALLGRAPMPSHRLFAARRFLRIYPLYLFVLVLSIGDMMRGGQVPSAGDVLAHLTMTQGFFTSWVTGINGPLWTMSVDAQFYVLLPVVAVLLARLLETSTASRRKYALWTFLALAVVGSIVFRCAALAFVAMHRHLTFDSVAVYARNVVGMGSEFAIGSAVAYLGVLAAEKPRSGSQARYLGLIALGAALFVLQWLVTVAPLHRIAAVLIQDGLVDLIGGCSGGLIIYGFTRGDFRGVTRVLASPAVEIMAVLAYAVYLVHDPILGHVVAWYRGPLGRIQATAVIGVTAFVAVVAVAFVLHYAVERPFLMMRDRRREVVEVVPTLP